VIKEWVRRFDKNVKNMYESGGRSNSQTRRQVGLISEYQIYGQQLGWHAAWLAAGQILASHPVVISEFSDPGDNAWLDWLQQFLLSRRDGLWLADGTDPPPSEARVNLLETEKKTVVLTGDRSKLFGLIGVKDGRLGQE